MDDITWVVRSTLVVGCRREVQIPWHIVIGILITCSKLSQGLGGAVRTPESFLQSGGLRFSEYLPGLSIITQSMAFPGTPGSINLGSRDH